MPMRFGEKLRQLREYHQLSQRALATALSLARRGYISNLEAGRKEPSLELVVRVARLFAITADALLRDDETIDPTISVLTSPLKEEGLPLYFGTNLRVLRKKHGLTQHDLANRLSVVRQSHISHVETNLKGPSLEMVVLVSDIFGIKIDTLLLQELD